MPLILFIVECGLELIPKELRTHPSVRRDLSTKNYASQLLDNALHHSAMKNLEDFEKRGRPDIIHACLLNALGSSLNKSGNLKIFIHTIHDKIYELNPEIKIARNFNRFKGLSAKFLIDEEIQVNGTSLISHKKGTLSDIIHSFRMPEIILFSSKGKLTKSQHLFSHDLSKNYIAVIGGFQKSSFSKKIFEMSNNVLSISKYSLDAWVVVNKVITYYEITHDIS